MVFAIDNPISIGLNATLVVSASEIDKVDHSMRLVVKLFWIVKHQSVSHVYWKVLAVKVIVPNTTLRHHEEAQELVGKN